jgi:hypothetical protein
MSAPTSAKKAVKIADVEGAEDACAQEVKDVIEEKSALLVAEEEEEVVPAAVPVPALPTSAKKNFHVSIEEAAGASFAETSVSFPTASTGFSSPPPAKPLSRKDSFSAFGRSSAPSSAKKTPGKGTQGKTPGKDMSAPATAKKAVKITDVEGAEDACAQEAKDVIEEKSALLDAEEEEVVPAEVPVPALPKSAKKNLHVSIDEEAAGAGFAETSVSFPTASIGFSSPPPAKPLSRKDSFSAFGRAPSSAGKTPGNKDKTPGKEKTQNKAMPIPKNNLMGAIASLFSPPPAPKATHVHTHVTTPIASHDGSGEPKFRHGGLLSSAEKKELKALKKKKVKGGGDVALSVVERRRLAELKSLKLKVSKDDIFSSLTSSVEKKELKVLEKKRLNGGGDVALSVAERHRLGELLKLKDSKDDITFNALLKDTAGEEPPAVPSKKLAVSTSAKPNADDLWKYEEDSLASSKGEMKKEEEEEQYVDENEAEVAARLMPPPEARKVKHAKTFAASPLANPKEVLYTPSLIFFARHGILISVMICLSGRATSGPTRSSRDQLRQRQLSVPPSTLKTARLSKTLEPRETTEKAPATLPALGRGVLLCDLNSLSEVPCHVIFPPAVVAAASRRSSL